MKKQTVTGRPLIVSDFDGAVTGLETQDVLLGKIKKPPSAVLAEMLERRRRGNYEIIRAAGLLEYAGPAGWHISNNGRMRISRTEGNGNGGGRIPPEKILNALGDGLEKYYGAKGPVAGAFFAAMLQPDEEIGKLASCNSWQEAHNYSFGRLKGGASDQFEFHMLINTLFEEFISRGQVVSAIREIKKNMRQGVEGLLAAARETRAAVFFCSYSYLEIVKPVIKKLSAKGIRSEQIRFVANGIEFEDNGANAKIAKVHRIGDKWAALDVELGNAKFSKKEGRYPNSVAYDDGIYNLPDMARRFETPILLKSSQNRGEIDHEVLEGRYPQLHIFSENGVGGVDRLRKIAGGHLR